MAGNSQKTEKKEKMCFIKVRKRKRDSQRGWKTEKERKRRTIKEIDSKIKRDRLKENE